jgi:hypothetical protein
MVEHDALLANARFGNFRGGDVDAALHDQSSASNEAS